MPKLETLELEIVQKSQTSTAGVKDLAEALSSLAKAGEATGKLSKASNALSGIASAAGGTKETSEGLRDVASALEQVGEAAKKNSGVGANIRNIGKAAKGAASKKLPTAGDDIATGEASGALDETAKKAEETRQSVGEATSAVHAFRDSLRGLGKGAVSIGKSLGKRMLGNFTKDIKSAVSAMGNLFSSFKRIAMYRALRTAIKGITQGFAEGVKHLYAWADLVGNNFKQSMDSLSTSMNYMKNSLGAMVSPIIDALAPAVDILVDKFVDLINVVNQFLATITGASSWRRAVKEQKEYADETDKAAGAQKRLNHQLMAFDELNNISASNPSGRGGGGNNDDVSADDFEEVPLPDWAKSIKDAIDRGDWAGAGSKLAEKLNNLVNNWDAEGFGNRLGEKFESALEFFNSFMEGTDWESVGTKLAGFVTGFLDKIDADQLGKAITQKFKAIVSTIKGFVWNVDLTKLATALGTAFNEIFSQDFMNDLGMTIAGMFNQVVTFVSTWVDTVDWEEDARNLIDGLMTAIKNTNWSATGETIGKIAAGIATFIVSAIDEIVSHPETIISAIKDLVSGIFDGIWGEDGSGMLNIVKLTGWVAGIKLLFGGLKSTFSSAFGSALTGGAAEAFSATGSAATAVKGYMDSFAGKLGTVALVVGLTYIIATSGELNTPEKAAEKVEKENPFFNAFEEGDSDAFKVGFIDALKNDSEVKAAYEANLYQWGKDSAHQDQNAALAAARKVYEAKFNLEDSSNAGGGGHKFWWETFKDGLDDISDSASTAAKKVKQLPPADDEVSKFQSQTKKETTAVNGVKTAANNAGSAVRKIELTKGQVNGVKNNLTTWNTKLTGIAESSRKAKKAIGEVPTSKKFTFTDAGNGLKNAASRAKTTLTQLNGLQSKYTFKVDSSTLGDKADEAERLYKALNNINSRSWRVQVTGDMKLKMVSERGNSMYFVEPYATGGFPTGDIFVANEAGPELVGTINGKTAVSSNQEITGIADAVYNTGEEEATLLREQNQLLRQLLAKNTSISLAPNVAAGRWVAQASNAYRKATGG